MSDPTSEDDENEPDGQETSAEIPDPRDTDHPAGDEHAQENIDNEPAG